MAAKGVIEALVDLMHRYPQHEDIQHACVVAFHKFSESAELLVRQCVG